MIILMISMNNNNNNNNSLRGTKGDTRRGVRASVDMRV